MTKIINQKLIQAYVKNYFVESGNEPENEIVVEGVEKNKGEEGVMKVEERRGGNASNLEPTQPSATESQPPPQSSTISFNPTSPIATTRLMLFVFHHHHLLPHLLLLPQYHLLVKI